MSILVDTAVVDSCPPYKFMGVVVFHGFNATYFEVTAKDGLLWCDGKVIPLPEADRLAWLAGFMCAERMVKAMDGDTR